MLIQLLLLGVLTKGKKMRNTKYNMIRHMVQTGIKALNAIDNVIG